MAKSLQELFDIAAVIDTVAPDVSYRGWILADSRDDSGEPCYLDKSPAEARANHIPPVGDDEAVVECSYYNVASVSPMRSRHALIDHAWWGEAARVFAAARRVQDDEWWTPEKWAELDSPDDREPFTVEVNRCHYLINFGGYDDCGSPEERWPTHYVVIDEHRVIRRHFILKGAYHELLNEICSRPLPELS